MNEEQIKQIEEEASWVAFAIKELKAGREQSGRDDLVDAIQRLLDIISLDAREVLAVRRVF